MPYISGEPHVLDDTRTVDIDKRDRLSWRDRYSRGQFRAVSALRTAGTGSGGVLSGKSKRQVI